MFYVYILHAPLFGPYETREEAAEGLHFFDNRGGGLLLEVIENTRELSVPS